jgi:hypothetical protein
MVSICCYRKALKQRAIIDMNVLHEVVYVVGGFTERQVA